MKQDTYCGLEGVFLCGSVPILFSSAFGERTGYDMDASYVFPQSVLAAIILVGAGTGGQVGRVGGQCEAGFSLAQWLSPPSWVWVLIPSCWSRSSEHLAHAGSVPFNCVLSSLPEPGPLPQRGIVQRQGLFGLSAHIGLNRVPSCLLCTGCTGSDTVGLSCFCPSQPIVAPNFCLLCLVWNHTTGQVGPLWTLSIYRSVSCDGVASAIDLGCF